MPVGAEAGIGKVKRVAAQALVRDQRAPEFDAIGPLDDEGQRHAERGGALRVAQQRGEVGRLAGAIDAALGIDESVEPVRRRTAADAAIGEIERRRLEAEEGVVALASVAAEHGGRGAALPVRQPGLELHVAAGIGPARGQALRCRARSAAPRRRSWLRSSPAN